MTLTRFAYRHAAPIDAAIIFPINLAFPLYFLWGQTNVPFWGWDGWAPFLVTASFFVGLLPTIFGAKNGINFQRHKLGPAVEPRPHWLRRAITRGLLLGISQAVIVALSLWQLQRVWPDLALHWLPISLANAGISALLGYFAQARGVLTSK